ncbi:MAG: hypothetical protein K8R99_02875 [Actinomycetia bacterium]|nr:hypothetical protein [Actinomycetes bacterium]
MGFIISSRYSKITVAVMVTVAAFGGWATASLAGEGEGGPPADPAVPGIPYVDEGPEAPAPAAGGGEGFAPIVTGSSNYDPTILTKFIPGTGFTPSQDSGLDADLVTFRSGYSCFYPSSGSAGSGTEVTAPIELPDGARIKQIIAFGEDSDAGDMTISLFRSDLNSSFGVVTRTESTVTSFSTSTASGEFVLASADNLGEITGSFGFFPTTHRFHSVHITMTNAALADHVICGVEVLYQVPATAAATGTVFYPIPPARVFDSRNPAYASSGLLAPNTNKVVSIKDGHDGAGAVNALDVVPAGATAVAYNITVSGTTGPNFLAVTAGDAGSFTTSVINFNGTSDLANAAVVAIASNRTIKIWGGDQSGSTHVIIDITGFYAPIPNMGN